MSKAEDTEQVTIDYTKPLAYSVQAALAVAVDMLEKTFKGKVPEDVKKVMEDMFMAGAFVSLDILMFGQDYEEGDVPSVEYSMTTLAEEAHEASRIIQILEDEDDDDEDEDGGGGGVPLMTPTVLH